MLDTGKDSSTKADSQTTGSVNGLNLKGFNSVGREDSTYERLRPPVNPAVLMRNFLLIGIVVILLSLVAFMAFKRSGLSFIPKEEDRDKTFAPPQVSPD